MIRGTLKIRVAGSGGEILPSEVDRIENRYYSALKNEGNLSVRSPNLLEHVLLLRLSLKCGLGFRALDNVVRIGGPPGVVVASSGTEFGGLKTIAIEDVLNCANLNVDLQNMASDARISCSFSLYHVGGILTQALPALLTEATLVLPSARNFYSVVQSLSDPEISHFHFSPYMLMLLKRYAPLTRVANTRATLVVGSSRLSRGVVDWIFSLGFSRFFHFYGLTEAPPPLLWSLVESENRHLSLTHMSPFYDCQIGHGNEIEAQKKDSGAVLSTGDLGRRLNDQSFRIWGRGTGPAQGLLLAKEAALLDLPFVSEVSCREQETLIEIMPDCKPDEFALCEVLGTRTYRRVVFARNAMGKVILRPSPRRCDVRPWTMDQN